MSDQKIPTWRLGAYGLLAIPLAMAELPIYINVPKFYSDVMGLNLAAIGGLLLASRLMDAIQDPLLGYWSDLQRDRGGRLLPGRLFFLAVGCPILCLGFLGLFNPPEFATNMIAWWFLVMLIVVYISFSMVQISYQAYGAEISEDPLERTRIVAYRAGLGLVGVLVAAALPETLSKMYGPREGYAIFSFIFIFLTIVLAGLTIKLSPTAPVRTPVSKDAFRSMLKPFKNVLFKRLLLIFMFNGIAAAIPATLVLFFIEDVIQRVDMVPAFLISYFAAGAMGMPLWIWLSARIGKGRAWLVGMIVSIVAFVWAYMLKAGDVAPFMIICIMSGIGLGADLSLPPSLLADVIDEDEKRGIGRNEGAYFGLWNLVTKMNLALAAGIALPALAMLGYQSKAANSPQSLLYLAGVYALLPCILKVFAVIALVFSPFFSRISRKRS